MRAVIQRVEYANCIIRGEITARIGCGLLCYACVMETDDESSVTKLAKKVAGLRFFSDENEKINLSLSDIGGCALVISNFTLSAGIKKGMRPDFTAAARPEKAIPLLDMFISLLREELGEENVFTGVFGADMRIESVCNGPVNIIYDTENIAK